MRENEAEALRERQAERSARDRKRRKPGWRLRAEQVRGTCALSLAACDICGGKTKAPAGIRGVVECSSCKAAVDRAKALGRMGFSFTGLREVFRARRRV